MSPLFAIAKRMRRLNIDVTVHTALGERDHMIDMELTDDGFVTNATDSFIALEDNLGVDILYELVELTCSSGILCLTHYFASTRSIVDFPSAGSGLDYFGALSIICGIV